MPGLRLSARTEMKECLDTTYSDISNDKPLSAKNNLKTLRVCIIKYYNTRGMECHRFDKIFSSIDNLLNNYQSNSRTREKLYDYLFDFDKELGKGRLSLNEKEEGVNNPITALSLVYNDLKEDYMDFKPGTGKIEKNEESKAVLDLLKEDLMEVTSLEPLFKSLNDDITYSRFNEVCRQADACLAQFPPIAQGPIQTAQLNKFIKAFESLFKSIVDVIVPSKEKLTIEDKDKEKEKTIAERMDEIEEAQILLKEEVEVHGKSQGKPSTTA